MTRANRWLPDRREGQVEPNKAIYPRSQSGPTLDDTPTPETPAGGLTTSDWKETALKFADNYHAELNRRIEAEQARAEDRARIEAALAADVDGLVHVDDIRAALTATEDGDTP